ncbi:MAG: hypothetical protein LBV78_26440 [Kitasatospora sp.]|jgi:hypothetical protein|nr:hypothetical protein [Kitasatospora sp.]
MSNDESAWYAASEPSTARLLPEEPVQPAHLRVGTVVPDSVPLEPQHRVLRTAEEGQHLAEPMEPLQPFQRVQAEPLQPFERGVPVQEAEPLQPFQRVQAEPLQPFERGVPAQVAEPLQPMEQGVRVRGDAEPERTLHRGVPAQEAEPLQPFERGVPAQEAEPMRTLQRGEATPERTLRRGETVAAKRNAAAGSGGSGNAGSGFQVDPDQYRAAVSPMLAASEQVASVYRSLSAFLPSMESQNPWGNDESGKKFAEGEKGYLKYSHDTMDVVKGLPEALKGIADGLKAMAESYQNADQNVVSELGDIDSTAQMPTSPSMPSTPVHVPMTPRITQSGRH